MNALKSSLRGIIRHLLATLLMALWGVMAAGTTHAEVYTSKAYGYSMEMPPVYEKQIGDMAEVLKSFVIIPLRQEREKVVPQGKEI